MAFLLRRRRALYACACATVAVLTTATLAAAGPAGAGYVERTLSGAEYFKYITSVESDRRARAAIRRICPGKRPSLSRRRATKQ